MKTKSKITIGLCTPLALIATAGYLILSAMHEKEAVQLTYPKGTLSESLFVSQNNTYQPSEELNKTYSFKTVPYLIDVYDEVQASVGNGSITKVDDENLVYLSEYTSESYMEEVMLAEFPPALYIDYSPEYTYLQNLESQNGYINGFAAVYRFDAISVSDGKAVKTAYMASYELTQPEEESPCHLLIATATTNASSEAFVRCKQSLDTITNTLRYDEKLNKEQTRQREQEEKLRQEEEEERQKEQEQMKENQIDPEQLIENSDVDAKLYPVTITTDQITSPDTYITVTSPNLTPESSIRLFEATTGMEITDVQVAEQAYTFHIIVQKDTAYYIKVTHNEEIGPVEIRIHSAQDEGTEQ